MSIRSVTSLRSVLTQPDRRRAKVAGQAVEWVAPKGSLEKSSAGILARPLGPPARTTRQAASECGLSRDEERLLTGP
jgi:hypothetical protein